MRMGGSDVNLSGVSEEGVVPTGDGNLGENQDVVTQGGPSLTSVRSQQSLTCRNSDAGVKRESVVNQSTTAAGEDEDTDLEEVDDASDKMPFREMCKIVYMESCAQMGVVPVSYFMRHMHDDELIMKHHGLGPMSARAVSVSLCTNTSIIKLDLEDNCLGGSGAAALAQMLKDNCYITDLNLSRNDIGSYGCSVFSDMLCENRNIRTLSLAGNGFGDRDAEHVARFIQENSQLKVLDLSHNEFCEVGGAILGPAIAENEILEHLDLSWNHLRRGGSIKLCEGVKNNSALQYVNLSFNGLGNEGAVAVSDLLKNNHALCELDVSNNRISTEGGVAISKGLSTNEAIKILRLGNNPMESAGTSALLQAMNNEVNAMQCLDLSNIAVDRKFLDLKKEMLQSRPKLDIIHGLVMGENDRPKPICSGVSADVTAMRELCNLLDTNEEEFVKTDPMALIRTYVDKHNLRLLDLFNSIDKNKSYRISKEDFINAVKSVGIKLTEDQVQVLVRKLNVGDDGMIDFREIAIGDRKARQQRRLMAKLDREVRKLTMKSGRQVTLPSIKQILALKQKFTDSMSDD